MNKKEMKLIHQGAKIGKYLIHKKKNTRYCWQTQNYIGVYLDVDDMVTLLDRAGITIDDVGSGSGAYVLGRWNDVGDYTVDNCRFITKSENSQESARVQSDPQWRLPL